MEEIQANVFRRLNEKFGDNLSNLVKCDEFSKQLDDEKCKIEKSLSLASSEVPSKVTEAVRDVEEISKEISAATAQYDSLSCAAQNMLMEHEASVNEMKEYISRIELLEQSQSYLCCVKDIEELSNGIELSILEKDDQQSVELYGSLCELYTKLQTSKCSHLVEFLRNTVHYWHNYLKDKFSVEFDEVLKLIRWPMQPTDSVYTYPSPEGLQHFQKLCEYLLQLELPVELASRPTVTSALASDFPAPSLPIALLLRPLHKRFVYHFYGARQTNRPDKPEWFFTQALNWTRDHESFVRVKVQPVMDKLGMRHKSAKLELMSGLVHLATEKLHSELPVLEYDPAMLAHAIDEALGFAREMCDSHGYPPPAPGVLGVLTQAHVFVRWIQMERKAGGEKVDAMLTSESAWTVPRADDLQVTECADRFLALLAATTDRYACLPQPGHRLQFLQLQLDMLDDFRVRLLQLLREEPPDPLASRLPVILNTVSYVATVIAEWGTQPSFLQLQLHRARSEGAAETDLEGSVFDNELALYHRMRDDLLDTLCESVMLETVARSRPYRKDKWYAMPSPQELIHPSLTPSVCPVFQVLSAKLHRLEQVLAKPLFAIAWRSIARQLNQFVYEEVVLQNNFNEGGALQLHFDMTRNLFPMFGQYCPKPDSLFPEVKESCLLLALPRGSALLLRETLHDAERSDAADRPQGTEVLADVGVHRLSVGRALEILASRTDFTNTG